MHAISANLHLKTLEKRKNYTELGGGRGCRLSTVFFTSIAVLY